MCWAERLENVNIQIADKDIEVYKVVCEANKQSCKSCVQDFMYEANTLYKIPSIEFKKSYMYRTYSVISIIFVQEAYHSYIKNFVYNPKCSNKIIPLTVQIPR